MCTARADRHVDCTIWDRVCWEQGTESKISGITKSQLTSWGIDKEPYVLMFLTLLARHGMEEYGYPETPWRRLERRAYCDPVVKVTHCTLAWFAGQ